MAKVSPKYEPWKYLVVTPGGVHQICIVHGALCCSPLRANVGAAALGELLTMHNLGSNIHSGASWLQHSRILLLSGLPMLYAGSGAPFVHRNFFG